MAQRFDLVIVGGGMIGTALAAALANRFHIALIETVWPKPPAQKRLDMRVSAINHSSIRLLKRLGVWDAIWRMCPFRHVEVWEEGGPPLRFSARDIACAQLGFIVENNLIQIALLEKIKGDITLLTAKVVSIDSASSPARVTLADGKTISSRLVIGADGRNSIVRQEAGIGIMRLEHPQQALIIYGQTENPQQDITWQRFTPTGAQAFLPLPGSAASLVWYNSPEYIKQLVAFKDKQFAAHLHHAYPDRLGKIVVEEKAIFPIGCHHTEEYVRGNALLIGDAAHSFHPLAGQGANFGFKDVEVLAELLNDISPAALLEYQSRRLPQNLAFMLALETMHYGFSNPALQLLRHGALWAARFPLIKKILIAQAAGEEINFLRYIYP